MDPWRTEWMQRRSDIALSLAKGDCGASYAEAAIILCAAISAVAAELRPGVKKDRARFVELLVETSRAECSLISVPLLATHLRHGQDTRNAGLLESTFIPYQASQVVTTHDVDRLEKDIIAVCPTVSKKSIRSCSYAVLLYEEVRSSYAHEYAPGTRADSWPMTSLRSEPASYINILGEPRRIHFHVEWVARIALSAAQYADKHSPPLADPTKWWVNG